MAEKATLARPYAKAIFAHAQQTQQEDSWQQVLLVLSELSSISAFCDMTLNPSVTAERLVTFIQETVAAVLPEQSQQVSKLTSVLQLLCERQRLTVMDAIAEQYEQLLIASRKAKDVSITSAFSLSDKQVADFKAALERRFSTDVRITTVVDEELMGGVIIRQGSWVMDGSVRGKLNNLTNELVRG